MRERSLPDMLDHITRRQFAKLAGAAALGASTTSTAAVSVLPGPSMRICIPGLNAFP